MNNIIFRLILLFAAGLVGILSIGKHVQSSPQIWTEILPGLQYAEMAAPQKSVSGDSRISILKIDTGKYALRLILAAQNGREFRTAKEWAQAKNLTAVINAGMYVESGAPTGYAKNYNYENKQILTPAYRSVLAFNPKNSKIPSVKLIDLQYESFDLLKSSYNTFLQNIRMIDSRQRNRWKLQPQISSIAALGMDRSGNVLFIFCRSPYTAYDFAAMLLKLPLNLVHCMYLEGGSAASLYVNAGDFKIEKSGGFETGIFTNKDGDVLLPIPNVIGITAKN